MDRTELLSRLREVFETRGYAGASLTEIARASGLSKASLYHHFPGGKLDMGEAVLREAGMELERLALAPLRTEAPPAVRLAVMLEGVEVYHDEGRRSCLLTVFAMGAGEAAFAEPIRDRLDAWIELIARAFQDAGRSRKDARRSARDLVARVQGAGMLARALGSEKPFRQVMRQLRDSLSGMTA
ncbi:MAG: TetR/AcrR family transcriptional regulator [Pseudomonadales bacterium]|jgi:AcrR family transcriptional regulator|nr:TetR/AcrR family transcriptional regulator [Pseudomonadales bacterium]